MGEKEYTDSTVACGRLLWDELFGDIIISVKQVEKSSELKAKSGEEVLII